MRGGCTIARVAAGSTELRETKTDVLGYPAFFPIFLIALGLIAVVVRQLFVHPPSTAVFIVCGVLAVLDAAFGWYLMRLGGTILVATRTDITFTARPVSQGRRPPPQVIRRASGSRLSFREQHGSNGGRARSVLKLHDEATGQEVATTGFARHRVRRACESQGWPFS